MFDQKRGKWKQRGLVAVQTLFEKDWLRLFHWLGLFCWLDLNHILPFWSEMMPGYRKTDQKRLTNAKSNILIQQSMASVKKGDGKEEIMEPRSTSVWEVGKTFLLFSNLKSMTLLYIRRIVAMIQICFSPPYRNPHQTTAVREAG